jgi:hypothetical protein
VLKGGDTGQSEPATVLHVSTTFSEVAENGEGCGWGGRQKIAPCWVLKEQPKAGNAGASARAEPAGLLFFSARHDLASHTGRGCGVGGERGVVGWSLVENCTVDASILFSVVKLSRANGGCLGTRSR